MAFFSRLFRKKKPLESSKGFPTPSATMVGYSQPADASQLSDSIQPFDPISTAYALHNEKISPSESHDLSSEETPTPDSATYEDTPATESPAPHDSSHHSHDSTSHDSGSSLSSDSASFDSGSSDSSSFDSGSSTSSDW